MSLTANFQEVEFVDEDILIGQSSNASDVRFDRIIGCIEEIIMEPKFQQMQENFMENNYKHFEDTDENKFIYTTIHREYINIVEKHLESQLKKRIENFSMDDFMSDLMSRKDEIDSEIFEILLTFEDFLEFKQLMLNHKANKEGKSIDLSEGICVKSLNLNTGNLSITGSSAIQARRTNSNPKSGTPLLDKTQVDNIDDSDNE